MKGYVKKLPYVLGLIVLIIIAIVPVFSMITEKSSQDPQVDYLIGMSHPNLSEEWQIIIYEEMKNEAAKHDNLRMIFTNADSSTYKQIKDINKLIDYGVDLLIITVNDVNAIGPLLNKINQQIPVIVLDRDVGNYDFTLFIGPDYYSIGKKAGERVCEVLRDKGGQVVEIRGPLEQPSVFELSHGFNDIINQHPNINIASSFSLDWLRTQSEKKMEELLEKTKDFDVVFAHNNAMALGAYYASQERDKEVSCIGVSGIMSNIYQSYIQEGILNTTFLCPMGGKEAVDYAIDILNGEEDIPKKIILRSIPITKDNVNTINQELTETLKDSIKVGYIESEDDYNNNQLEMKVSILEQDDIELYYESIPSDLLVAEKQKRQISRIEEFIDMNVDLIALSPVISTNWDDILAKTSHANIPIILLNNEVDSKEDLWTTYIGSDYYDQGKLAASYLVNNVYNTDSDMVIAELSEKNELSSTIQRSDGFNQIINGYSRINVQYKMEMESSIEAGKENMNKILKESLNQVNVVFTHDENIALGAILAIEENGLTLGKDIVIVTTTNTIDAGMNNEKIDCLVQSNPIQEKQLLKVIRDFKEGKQLPKKIISRDKVIVNK